MNTHSLFEIKLCLLCRNLVPPFLINTRFICCWNEQSTFYIGRSFPQLLGAQQTSIQYCIQTFSHRLNGMDILKIRPASSPNSLKSIKISLENIFILSICKLFLFSHFSRIRTEYGAIRGRDVSKIYDGPVNYIGRNAPLQIFDRVLNTRLRLHKI